MPDTPPTSRAAPDGYYLSPPDYALFQDMARAWRASPANDTRHLPYDPEDGYQGPEVYVATAPVGGIPALTAGVGTAGDVPGAAECVVHQIDRTRPTIDASSGAPRTVYNLSTTAVAGGATILAVRDKFGAFVAVTPGGSSGDATGGTTCKGMYWLRSTKCVRFRVTSANGLCASNVTIATVYALNFRDPWVADDQVVTGLGYTTLTFDNSTTVPTLTALGNGTGTGTDTPSGSATLKLIGCVGDALAFVGGGELLCPGTPATCDDTFLVLVDCTPCESVPCADVDLPVSFCLRLTADTGGLTYSPATATYAAAPPTGWEDHTNLLGPAWYAVVPYVNSLGDTEYALWAMQRTATEGVCELTYSIVFTSTGTNPPGVGATSSESGGTTGFTSGDFPQTKNFQRTSGLSTYYYDAVFNFLENDDCTDPGTATSTSTGTGGSVCCTGAGESLEAHPTLEVVVPDGGAAGTYNFTWDAGDSRWEGIINEGGFSPAAWAIECADSTTCPPSGGLRLRRVVGIPAACATSTTCSPFAATFPAIAAIGNTADITVSIA